MISEDVQITLSNSGLQLAVYLINMDGAADRLQSMQDKLKAAGLPYRRIAGVNGRRLSFPHRDFSEWHYRVLHGRRTAPAEVGCYFSHISCAKNFLETKADLALILEDDVSFHDGFAESIDRAAQHRGLWNILRLTTVNKGRKFPVRDLGDGKALAIALTREKGAGAYVIDRKAARWFVNSLIPMRLAFDIAFDLEYLYGLRACFITPLPASQYSGHETQIQHTVSAAKLPRWRYFSVLPYRAWLEASRLVLRGWHLLTARVAKNFLK